MLPRVLIALVLASACKRTAPRGALEVGQITVSDNGLAATPEIGESAQVIGKELAQDLEGTGRFVVKQGGPVQMRLEIERAQRTLAPVPVVQPNDTGPVEREMAVVAVSLEMTSTGPQGDVDRLLAEGEARRPPAAPRPDSGPTAARSAAAPRPGCAGRRARGWRSRARARPSRRGRR